jgi:Ni,Fe-hydrogenase III large subunit/Ni,Fe-hydrogenase III component G
MGILKPNSTLVTVPSGALRDAITTLLDPDGEITVSTLSGVDLGDEIELNYHMRVDGTIATIRTCLPKADSRIQSIVDLVPGVAFFERENHDLLGVTFEGNSDLRRLVLPENWPDQNYPLRKEWTPNTEDPKNDPTPEDSAQTEQTENNGTLINVVFGPQHPALLEPEKFALKVDGEVVVDVEPRIGYVHRGVEKAAEKLTFSKNVHLVERICGICNTCHTTCFCQAVESILGVEVPPRALFIRTIMLELNRIHSHLLLLGTAGLEMGYETLFQYMWRDREPIMDIIESISGNRVITSMNTVGGVRRDLKSEAMDTIKQAVANLRERMNFYERLFTEDESLKLRTQGIGLLKQKEALSFCTVGPVARASGLKTDVRKDEPYAAYEDVPFNVVTLEKGDSWTRFIVRIKEVLQSARIIEFALDHLPDGPCRVKVQRAVPKGEAISRVEAPRGELFYYVKSNGGALPERVKVRTPTFANILSFCETAKGCNVADVPAIFASFDPCFSCTDR